MVEIVIWCFLATVVVAVTALLGFLVLRKVSPKNDSFCCEPQAEQLGGRSSPLRINAQWYDAWFYSKLSVFLNYGQNPRSAEDLCLGISEFPMNADARDWLQEKQQSFNIAKDCLHEAMIRQASNADRHKLDRTFLENQEVLVHRDHIGVRGIEGQPCAKLRHRWIGPFKTLQVLSPTTVKLELPSCIRVNSVFNISVLKHYEAPTPEELDETFSDEHEASWSAVEEPPPPPPLPIIDNDGHERFLVEKVLQHKFHRKRLSF